MVILPLPPQERIRSDFLHKEYERGGIPVFEVTYREWKSKFYHLTNEDYDAAEELMGVYYNGPFDSDTTGLPHRFIVINKTMSNSWRLAVYYHELGHHSCVRMKCSCAKNGFVFKRTELHAELAAVFLATQRGFRQMTMNAMAEAVMDLEHHNLTRIENAVRMVKHPVFEAAKTFAGSLFTDWLKSHKHLKERYEYALADESARSCRWQPSRFLQRYTASQ